MVIAVPIAAVRESLPPVDQLHPDQGLGHLADLPLLEAVGSDLVLDAESPIQVFDTPLVLRTVVGTQVDTESAGRRVEAHDGTLLMVAAVGSHNQTVIGDVNEFGIAASTHRESPWMKCRVLFQTTRGRGCIACDSAGLSCLRPSAA